MPRLVVALRSGLAMTVGFAGTFVAVALAVTFGLRPLMSWTPWLVAGLGVLILLAGLALLAGLRLPRLIPGRISTPNPHQSRSMIIFGMVYATASLSCTLPVVVALTAQTLAATNLASLTAVLGGYVAGAATTLLLIAVATALAAGLPTRLSHRLLPHASRIAGLILAATGCYLVLYWAPTLTGGNPPNDRAWTSTTATAADWITTHPEIAITATATLLVLVAVITTVARTSQYKTRSRTSHLDSTPPPDA